MPSLPIQDQADFSLGEIDPLLERETRLPQFLQGVGKCRNMFVTGQGIVRKRGAFGIINNPVAFPPSPTSVVFKTLEYEANNRVWYQILLEEVGASSRLILIKYQKDLTLGVQVPVERFVFATLLTAIPKDIDMTAVDTFVVLVNGGFDPKKLTVDATTLSNSVIEPMAFSVLPSIDFGDLDYSKYSFDPLCYPSNSAPTGNPPHCNIGDVFGSKIVVDRPNAADPKFGPEYIGGLIVGQTGASPEQPLGFGIITSIVDHAPTEQWLLVTVLQNFGTADYSKGGPAWSVRKPMFGTTTGFPKTTTFFKGRLWFGGTPSLPMGVMGSKINTPANFNVGGGQDPDAIAYIEEKVEGGGIKHLVGGTNLLVFTGQQQLASVGGDNTGITPSNFDPEVVASYTTSDMKPIQYRNFIYFVTADGKALVEIQEAVKQIASTVVSYTSEHLIRNPIQVAVSTIQNTQDQVLALLNEDGTICIYSKSLITQVKAFSLYEPNLLPDEIIRNINVIDNVLYAITDKLRLLYTSLRIDFDGWEKITMTSGIINVSDYPIIQAGDTLDVSFEATVSGNTNNNYLGEFVVFDDGGVLKINVNRELTTDNAYIGKRYISRLRTLPLFSSAQGSFKFRKVSQALVQFYQSFGFLFNGKRVALLAPDEILPAGKFPFSKTGTARQGYSEGYKQDFVIDIVQDAPYDLVVQKLIWSEVEEMMI